VALVVQCYLCKERQQWGKGMAAGDADDLVGKLPVQKRGYVRRSLKIEEEVLRRLSLGEPLAEICRTPGFPHPATWRDWCRSDNKLAIAYAGAREDGEDLLAAQCLTIADTPAIGLREKVDENGVVIETTREDMLGHRKLQIDTRLKLLAKWNPKKWGDKILHGEDADNPLGKGTVEIDVFKLADQMREAKRLAANPDPIMIEGKRAP
tara:strand:- start:4041 stop:4664 length:624 start_codon:yes stop_codon:yes gene_type:complete